MTINIVDTANKYLTPDISSKASAKLGEKETSINKALTAVVPLIFSGLISRSSTLGTAGSNDILTMANDSYSSGLLDNVDNMFNEGGLMSRGGGMLDGLFGDKLHGLVSSIGNFAGIKNSSANCLFSLAAPVAMASVGKYTAEEKLESDGLSNFLWSQKENVMAAIPSGLAGITSVFGFAKADPVADNPRQAEISSAVYNNRASVNRPARTKWMLLSFVVVVGGVVAWIFLK